MNNKETMKYLISEEELSVFLSHCRNDLVDRHKESSFLIDEFLKSKKPIKLIMGGKQDDVKRDFIHWVTFKNPYKNLDIYIKERKE